MIRRLLASLLLMAPGIAAPAQPLGDPPEEPISCLIVSAELLRIREVLAEIDAGTRAREMTRAARQVRAGACDLAALKGERSRAARRLLAAAESATFRMDPTRGRPAQETVLRARRQLELVESQGADLEGVLAGAAQVLGASLAGIDADFEAGIRIAFALPPEAARMPPRVSGTTTVVPPLVRPLRGVDPAAGRYEGCFRDTSDFDLKGHLERSAQNTPSRCAAICRSKGYAYAGVQYGESCLCGNSFGRYGPASNCDYACTGDSRFACGGYSANSVYATGAAATGGGAPGGITTTPQGQPTEWLDRDDPQGEADWEALADMAGSVPCAQPIGIECRVKNDRRDWRQAGQRMTCGLGPPTPGGICRNADNPGGCHDYEVRFFCPQQGGGGPIIYPPLPPPPPPPPPGGGATTVQGQPTEWLDRDDPQGEADWEALADMAGSVPCAQPIGIECRVKSDRRDWRQAGQRMTCGLGPPTPGGICRNADNPGGCHDYEVRFFCPQQGGGGPITYPPPPPPPPRVAGCDGFSGKWDSDYGPVELAVQGGRASGRYANYNGTIEGIVSGNVLEGRWIQPDRSGLLRFALSADGQRFQGTWTEAGGGGGGYWNGTCARTAAQVTPPPRRAAAFLGCYKDTSDFDVKGHLERSAQNTPQRCVSICFEKGYSYAAVQYGESCLCGNSYGRYGPADNCNFRCTGDAGQTCGGYNANSVYSTGR